MRVLTALVLCAVCGKTVSAPVQPGPDVWEGVSPFFWNYATDTPWPQDVAPPSEATGHVSCVDVSLVVAVAILSFVAGRLTAHPVDAVPVVPPPP